jgi:hypothetical protein
VDDVVRHAIEAMRGRDWETLRPLVHPYVHWTDAGGTTRRGRTRLMASLVDTTGSDVLEVDEIRDGQLYRLRVSAGSKGLDAG